MHHSLQIPSIFYPILLSFPVPKPFGHLPSLPSFHPKFQLWVGLRARARVSTTHPPQVPRDQIPQAQPDLLSLSQRERSVEYSTLSTLSTPNVHRRVYHFFFLPTMWSMRVACAVGVMYTRAQRGTDSCHCCSVHCILLSAVALLPAHSTSGWWVWCAACSCRRQRTNPLVAYTPQHE